MKKEIVLLIPTNKREVFLNILVFLDFCYGVLHARTCVRVRARPCAHAGLVCSSLQPLKNKKWHFLI